jgi:hypothetical protein
LGIEVAQIKHLLVPHFHLRHRPGDLARDEGLTTQRTLVMKRIPLDACIP